MGELSRYLEHRLARDLDTRRVVVWYDPERWWEPWVQRKLGPGALARAAQAREIDIDGRLTSVVPFTGSYYELALACEPLVGEDPRLPVLVYLPGEHPEETLSPLRELECLGGDREPYRLELLRLASAAFKAAGLAEAKIDELLGHEGVSFDYLEAVKVGDDGGASPLQPIFGSSREIDVVTGFLSDLQRRHRTAAAGLLPELTALVSRGLGFDLSAAEVSDKPAEQVADMTADQLARTLLVTELRSNLSGPEPLEIFRVSASSAPEHIARARAICQRLRHLHPDTYECLADQAERDLGLDSAEIDPKILGRIDTFRFEEQRLLAECDRLLAEDLAQEALIIVEGRSTSFWVSVDRYPQRRAAWDACGSLARLALVVAELERQLGMAPSSASVWVERYAAPNGWHRADRLFRDARYRLSRIGDDAELEGASQRVFQRYDAAIERMAAGFAKALAADGWEIKDVVSQPEIYSRFVAKRPQPVAYLLVDAMRFEMGSTLGELLAAAGAEGLQLQPAAAVLPTITEIGMAALLPGAERSFSLAMDAVGITGAIDGKALSGSAARMDFARGAVPGSVEMTMDRLLNELSQNALQTEVKDARLIIIRSQEIDGAGESLPDGVARTVMGTVLETVRKAVLRLANAGVKQFVITADHGHLFGPRRGHDMKIDPPQGGETVDLHRRCWIGRGGETPSSCIRISASQLGYQGTDLDLVVPKGLGVFKSGGSLVFHHGGLSLQELIVPVMSFELKGKDTGKGKASAEIVSLEQTPREITNLIFSLSIRRVDLPIEPIRLRVLAETADSEGTRVVAQAVFATRGWDPEARTVTLEDTEPVSVGMQIDDEEVSELRVLVIQVATDRTLKDTPPIPVRVTR